MAVLADMDERALICAWLTRYLNELEVAANAVPGAEGERFAHECEAIRAALWAIESGDYLTDLASGIRH